MDCLLVSTSAPLKTNLSAPILKTTVLNYCLYSVAVTGFQLMGSSSGVNSNELVNLGVEIENQLMQMPSADSSHTIPRHSEP